jgi:hypothetical protein
MATVKILFLDFDGVLNSTRSSLVQNGFDNLSVKLLYKFLKENDVKVVISSAWRYSWTIEDLRYIFEQTHLWEDASDIIIDMVGTEPATRGWQIDGWIFRYEKETGNNVKFVILDDRDDMEPYMHRLVKTDMDDGLLYKHYQQLLEKMNG